MDDSDFQEVMRRLGLSQRQMAERLGLARNTANAYATGKAPIPHYIALACAALLAGIPAFGKTVEDE